MSDNNQKQGYLYCGNCKTKVTFDMNFCPRCGAPFKSTAVPTPIYSSVYIPTNTPPPTPKRMPIALFGLNAVMWGFLGFFTCFINDGVHQVPLVAIFPVTISGVLVGFYPVYRFTQKRFRALEVKGEIALPSQKKVVLYLILAIAATIIGAILLLPHVPANPPFYFYLVYNFMYPGIVTIWAVSAIMWYRWQKKNNKLILTEKNKLIAVRALFRSKLTKN